LGDFTEAQKGLAKIGVGDAIGKVAYVNIHRCLSLKFVHWFDGTLSRNQARERLRQRGAFGSARGGRGAGSLAGKSVGFRRNWQTPFTDQEIGYPLKSA
jgi:hypothetical protein